jgi:hypothetical protein
VGASFAVLVVMILGRGMRVGCWFIVNSSWVAMLVLRITEVRGYTVEQNKPDGEKEPERAEPRPDAGRMGRPHRVEMRSGIATAPQKGKPLCRLLLQSTQRSRHSRQQISIQAHYILC